MCLNVITSGVRCSHSLWEVLPSLTPLVDLLTFGVKRHVSLGDQEVPMPG